MSKGLEALGKHVAEELDRLPADETAARARFLRAAAQPAKRRMPGAVYVGAGGLALAAGVALLIGHHTTKAPSYETAGAPAQVGVELGETSSPIRFSDGSHVDIHGGGQMRVAALDARGARLVLEKGSAHFDLVTRAGSDWTVQAGGFEVHGSGARFELSFLVSADEVDLAVEEGHVDLAGACVEKRAVTAPAHVHVSCAQAQTPAPTQTAEVEQPPNTHGVAAAPKTSAVAPRPSWRALAAQSRWRDALDAALPTFDNECDDDSAADLLALGDVARLAHDAPHARHAYESLRARFPSDSNAPVAAFSLGKLAFDEDHAYGEAGRQFDTYLREQPRGPLTRDALARSMDAHERNGDHAGARALAKRYLDEYPGGPQEEAARGIVGR